MLCLVLAPAEHRYMRATLDVKVASEGTRGFSLMILSRAGLLLCHLSLANTSWHSVELQLQLSALLDSDWPRSVGYLVSRAATSESSVSLSLTWEPLSVLALSLFRVKFDSHGLPEKQRGTQTKAHFYPQ